MQSAKRTITSGNRVREVDLYSGFNKNLMQIYNENQDDEAFQNAVKVSSYGKRNTTPKTNWVGLNENFKDLRFISLFLEWREITNGR